MSIGTWSSTPVYQGYLSAALSNSGNRPPDVCDSSVNKPLSLACHRNMRPSMEVRQQQHHSKNIINNLFAHSSLLNSLFTIPPPQKLYEFIHETTQTNLTGRILSTPPPVTSRPKHTRCPSQEEPTCYSNQVIAQDLSVHRTTDKWEHSLDMNSSDNGTILGTIPSPSTNSSPTDPNSSLNRTHPEVFQGYPNPGRVSRTTVVATQTICESSHETPSLRCGVPNFVNAPHHQQTSGTNVFSPTLSNTPPSLGPAVNMSHTMIPIKSEPRVLPLPNSLQSPHTQLVNNCFPNSPLNSVNSFEHFSALQKQYYEYYCNWLNMLMLNSSSHMTSKNQLNPSLYGNELLLAQLKSNDPRMLNDNITLTEKPRHETSSVDPTRESLQMKTDLAPERLHPNSQPTDAVHCTRKHPLQLENRNTAEVNTFACKLCTKTYSQASALKMHVRTHTLPCRCSHCGKSFSRKWLLKGHERIHTGERPYSCSVCGRSFADRSNLRAHMQTHQREKRYSCPNCPRSFSRMGLLNKHVTQCIPAFGAQQPIVDHRSIPSNAWINRLAMNSQL